MEKTTYQLKPTALPDLEQQIAETAMLAHQFETYGGKAKEALKLLVYQPAKKVALADHTEQIQPATGILTQFPSIKVKGGTVALSQGSSYEYPEAIEMAEEALRAIKQISKNGGGFVQPQHASAFLRLLGLRHDAAACEIVCGPAPEGAEVALTRGTHRPEVESAAPVRSLRSEFKLDPLAEASPASLRMASEDGPRALIRWANQLLMLLPQPEPQPAE